MTSPPKAQTPINAQAHGLQNRKSLTGERLPKRHERLGNPPTEQTTTLRCWLNSQVTGQGEGKQTREMCMLSLAYLIAITAEAMTGALAAGRRNMDLFGVSLIAFITALGGGTVRDILLGNFPVNWTQHPQYIYLTIGAGLCTIVIAKVVHKLQQLFLVLDAIGLITFTLIGCNVGLTLGYEPAVVVIAGIITGIFGGILRDLLCDRPPEILHKELYASIALVVALMYLQMQKLGINEDTTLLAAFSVGLLLRMSALKWHWQLPTFTYAPERWQSDHHI